MQPESPSASSGPSYDVELLGVTKVFAATPAVDDLTLKVKRGTFFSLLGPSGCGKTTTLRLIAGFEQPTSGRVIIGGNDVAGLPPYRRDVNTVFQHYALFPHMSVADNIAYGLRQRGVPRSDIQRRVAEALQMVRLPNAGPRRPLELSGGQQQRVALARALVNRPTVLLLDEPLSALDLKLRKEMQSELKILQQTVGITFIYVTHDQDEAITLSDRMVVMNTGRLEQEGTPEEIYERPRTRFVADFIGLTNFLEGVVRQSTAETAAGAGMRCVVLETPVGLVTCAGRQPDVAAGERVTLTLRPEKIRLFSERVTPGDGWNAIPGVVMQATFLGPQNEYHVRVGDIAGTSGRALSVRQQNISTLGTLTTVNALQSHDSGTESGWHVFGPGERVMVSWRNEASLILRDTGPGTQQAEAAQSSAPATRPTLRT